MTPPTSHNALVAAVWMAARAQLRRRWGATVALALLVGLAGGVVIAAVAGASRTETSMKRFVAYSRPEAAYVNVNGHLVNEGIVASMPMLQELSNELGTEGQRLFQLRSPWGMYFGFDPAGFGIEGARSSHAETSSQSRELPGLGW